MKKYIVQYEKTKYVTYIVRANNEEEAKVVADNLREKNQGYEEEIDDCNYDSIIRFHKVIEK